MVSLEMNIVLPLFVVMAIWASNSLIRKSINTEFLEAKKASASSEDVDFLADIEGARKFLKGVKGPDSQELSDDEINKLDPRMRDAVRAIIKKSRAVNPKESGKNEKSGNRQRNLRK